MIGARTASFCDRRESLLSISRGLLRVMVGNVVAGACLGI